MPNYNSTARVPFKTGGSVKKPKVKRIILWKGKAKDWPGAKEAARQTRNRKAEGGIIGFKKGGIASESARKKNKEAQAKSIGKAKKFVKRVGDPFQLTERLWTPLAKKIGKKYNLGKNKKQGYKDREDESLGMRTGPESSKKQSMKDRRDESYGKWGKRPNQRINRAKGGKAKDSVHQPTTHSWWLLNRNKRDKKAKGGKADKNWIQGVNKSIKKRGTKGVCTGKKFGSASCKPGSRRYNLAKTFKKMARAKHASGGLVRYI